jgi:hypothetical protein
LSTHLTVFSDEDGHGSISSAVFIRDAGTLWLHHYVVFAWRDKSQYMVNPIVTKEPPDLGAFGQQFLRQFESSCNHISGTDRVLAHMQDFTQAQVMDLVNQVYESMWDLSISPGRPSRKVDNTCRKICTKNMFRLVDVWYKSEMPAKERPARIPKSIVRGR